MPFLLPAVGRDFDLSSGEQSLLAAMVFGGIACGTFLCGALSDKFGRRPVFIGTALISGICGL